MHEMSAKLKWNEINEGTRGERWRRHSAISIFVAFFYGFQSQFQFQFQFHFHVWIQLVFNLSISDIDTKVRRKLQNKVKRTRNALKRDGKTLLHFPETRKLHENCASRVPSNWLVRKIEQGKYVQQKENFNRGIQNSK